MSTIQVKHHFKAAPERVFDAWLDPQKARNFLFATRTGEIVRCDIDPRVGGAFKITDRRDGEDIDHTGQYLEIDRPKKLVFTLAVPKYSPLYTTVTLEIQPAEDGCNLTLTHEGVLEEYAKETPKGWTMIFESLERVI